MRTITLTIISLILTAASAQEPVRVLTHSSFDLPLGLIEQFTGDTGWPVQILQAGDAGELVNRAILTAGRPQGDVLFGVDEGLLARALDANVFSEYVSPAAPEHHLGSFVTPVTYGYVAFNLDRDYPAPADIADLADPEFAGLTVVQDPAASSTGMSFMLLTIARFGDGWLDYWAALRDNGLQVTAGWTDAYYTAFTRYGGDRPYVLSYLSSPAAEVMFAEEPLTESPTANLLCDGCVWRQTEAAGVLAGSSNEEGARAFIDFLLSPAVQEAIPEAMFVYPVVPGTPLPEEFRLHADVPEAGQLVSLEPGVIAAEQATWLNQWTAVVLQGRSPDSVR